ncbi:MAG: ComEC/Rec2 family competence protein, partial [Chloroflexota bacterium]
AISGFNMVILAGVIERLLENTPLPRLWVGIISVLVIGVYTVFVGGDAAVTRAAVMSGVLVVGRAMNRNTYVPASLAFVALLMSAINPRVLWSVSFQLSFFATLGLALFADPLTRWFDALLDRLFSREVATGLSNFLSEPIIVTIAALIPTLPLTALYFNRVSLVQLPVNLLIVPVQAAVLISGIAATLVHFVSPPLAQIIYWFDMALLWWSVTVVRWFADVPYAEVDFFMSSEPINLFFTVLIIGAVLQATQPEWALRLWRFLSSRAVFSSVMFASLVAVGLNLAVIATLPDGRMHVYMLDVGHSNGVLVQTPRGAQILIDGGRFPSRLLTQLGDRMPYNDRHIELLVITQPDEFQYGALPAVLNRYSVGAVLTNGQPNLSDAYEELQVALAPYGVQTVTAGYTVEFADGVLLEVLAPYETPELTDSMDATALVTRLSYRNVSFLFSGNVSGAGQAAMLERGAYPLATVMQIPQHGTVRSIHEEFMAQAQPQVYLLQSDRTNLRGDPNPDTLALLDGDLPLLRTDEQGVVHVWTDGARLWTR